MWSQKNQSLNPDPIQAVSASYPWSSTSSFVFEAEIVSSTRIFDYTGVSAPLFKYSVLPVYCESRCKHYLNKWVWLYSSKDLCTKTAFGLYLVCWAIVCVYILFIFRFLNSSKHTCIFFFLTQEQISHIAFCCISLIQKNTFPTPSFYFHEIDCLEEYLPIVEKLHSGHSGFI